MRSKVFFLFFFDTRFSSSVVAATGDQGKSIGYTLVIHHSRSVAVTSHDRGISFACVIIFRCFKCVCLYAYVAAPPFPLSTTMLLTCRFLPYFHNRNDLTVLGGHFVPLLQMEEDIDN